MNKQAFIIGYTLEKQGDTNWTHDQIRQVENLYNKTFYPDSTLYNISPYLYEKAPTWMKYIGLLGGAGYGAYDLFFKSKKKKEKEKKQSWLRKNWPYLLAAGTTIAGLGGETSQTLDMQKWEKEHDKKIEEIRKSKPKKLLEVKPKKTIKKVK